MKPLRIVYAIPFFEPATQFGGPVMQVAAICSRLALLGHSVRVVTTDLGVGPDVQREAWLERNGCKIWYGRTGLLNRMAPYYAPMLKGPLEEALQEADVLHLQLGLTLVNALGHKMALCHSVPYVYTPHGVLCPIRIRRQRRLAKIIFMALFERRIIRDASALQALTTTEAATLRQRGGHQEKIRLIPNGIEMGLEETWPDGRIFREQFDIPSDALLLLFMGRLQKIKGLDLLVEAFARARKKFPNLMLAVAGPEEDFGRQTLKQAQDLGVAGSVRFTGTVTGEMRLAAFRAANLFVLASYSEGLPLAVLEACAMGLPVLITDRCNVPQVAEYGAGRVVGPDADALAQAIEQMLSDPEALHSMGTSAKRMVAERFSMQRVVQELESLYGELAGG